MFEDINSIFQVTISFEDLIKNLLVAFICGIIISFFYRKSYSGPGYLSSFVSSLIILSMITAIVIMVIGNNLARAFGLVGAMSIIRFRTAVKDTQDIIYIFFALAIGMAAGVGLHGLAFSGSIFIGMISLVLAKTDFISPSKQDFLLQFTVSSLEEGNGEYKKIIKKYCKRESLINMKTIGHGDVMEFSYHVGFKHKEISTNLIKELKQLEGVNHVNLFFDEEYF